MSPTTGRISCRASSRALASVRASPQTLWPARANPLAMADPTYPVAPVTKTCIGLTSVERYWSAALALGVPILSLSHGRRRRRGPLAALLTTRARQPIDPITHPLPMPRRLLMLLLGVGEVGAERLERRPEPPELLAERCEI